MQSGPRTARAGPPANHKQSCWQPTNHKSGLAPRALWHRGVAVEAPECVMAVEADRLVDYFVVVGVAPEGELALRVSGGPAMTSASVTPQMV